MQILLVRHAKAVDTRSAQTDYERWLTKDGRETMSLVGEALVKWELRYSRIYTSPLVRAVQTAELLAASQPSFNGPVEVLSALSTEEGTMAQVLEPLEDAEDDELIVMVSHMPKIGLLAAHLGRLTTTPSFQPASACLLSVEAGPEANGCFQWMLDPETLERKRA